MSIKLRELIRQVRSCKTAAEERSLIFKECAQIRACFKEDESQYKQRNIAKLLFIHMLGYPSQFGQVECLKLIASNKFSEKRIGYLAICQLLDEDSDILLLATNSIKNDLNHSNQYINGLALSAIANTAPKEMCRAVFREVCELLMVGNPFIKKRALLASVNIVRVLDDVEIEPFINCMPSLLEDKHHAVILGTCHLMSSIIEHHKEYIEFLRPFLPILIKTLNSISMAGYLNSIEYESGGVTDQFLQVHILIVIGNLKTIVDDTIKESLCAMLAQLLTNTDHSKNGGNSILYECVRTIIKLLPYVNEDVLYMLAVNTVTKFLQNTDLNIKFVALGLLENMKDFPNNTTNAGFGDGNNEGSNKNANANSNDTSSDANKGNFSEEPKDSELAPHHKLILDCLKDSDSSIKFRALKVLFSIINEGNIKVFIKDLLNVLLVSTESDHIDFSTELSTGMCMAIRKCKNINPKWFIDTYIKLFCLAGNIIREEERDNFISYLTSLSDSNLHSYTVKKLYLSLINRMDQVLLIQVTIWALGEYSQYLFSNNNSNSNSEFNIDSSEIDISETSVLNLIEEILIKNTMELNSHNCSLSIFNNNYYVDYSNPIYGVGVYTSVNTIETTINFSMVALVKSSIRLNSQKDRISQLIKSQINSTNIEIQQRAIEFLQIMNSNWDSNRKHILNPLPVFDLSNLISNETRSNSFNNITVHSASNNKNDSAYGDGLFVTDLLDLDSSNNNNAACDGIGSIHNNSSSNRNDCFNSVGNDNSNNKISNSNIIDLFDEIDNGKSSKNVGLNNNFNNNLINIGEDLNANNSRISPKKTSSSPFEDLLDFSNINNPDGNVKGTDVGETITIYKNNDVRIDIDISKNKYDDKQVNIIAKYYNLTNLEISNFKLEISIPKYLNIHLENASANLLLPNNGSNPVTQNVRINKNDSSDIILMKLRIKYIMNGNQVVEYSNVNNIPSKY
ncbi:adapter-protein complex 1 gamma subunit (gamma adaptin) [Cryptosporidium ryanae]|uniref:adapter-protein complex 1 gamma subunit (gamma adaptin) n=1 Tax=Cryptosporidium ryanae TaxID=515981 RepID=UPI00351A180B|nr:adapter-protein complex 1 gamma subunit (gamma adaptin) [Cryptosporidium ryanae]